MPSIRENKISTLVFDKFPKTQLKITKDIFGKNDFSAFDIATRSSELKKEFELADKYRKELQTLSDEEINRLYKPVAEKQEKERKEKIEEIENRLFHHPRMKADFYFWNKADTWTVEEFVALNFEKEPKLINKEYIIKNQRTSSIDDFFAEFEFPKEYLKRLELISRSVEQFIESNHQEKIKQIFNKKSIEKVTLPTKYYIDWAKNKNITLPKELSELEPITNSNKELLDRNSRLLEQYKELLKSSETLLEILKEKEKKLQISQDDNKKLTAELQSVTDQFEKLKNEKILGITDKKSVLKMIYGMAVVGYSWDPEAKSSPATKEITTDINESCNKPITDDTVRKWLKEAKKFADDLDLD